LKHKILLVDDEASVRTPVRRHLETHGFEVLEAATLLSGDAIFRAERPDLAVVDFMLPDGDALDLLPRLRATDPDLPVIVLTGRSSLDLAMRTVKGGAEHVLTKPVELAALVAVVQRAFEVQRLRRRDAAARHRRHELPGPNPLLGTSPAIAALAGQARLAAAGEDPVLLVGEPGTGRGRLARWLHDNGPRAEEAFLAVRCDRGSRELPDSTLFGQGKVKGALEVAHRGSLFLTELDAIDLAQQPRLLEALEEKRSRRLGEVVERRADVRLLAATAEDLAELVREKRFRPDLFSLLARRVLKLPPLRERPGDVPALAGEMVRHLAEATGRPGIELAPDAAAALAECPWPGNLRELRNVVERGVLACQGRQLLRRHLRLDGGPPPPQPSGDSSELTLDQLERRHIEGVLEREKGHVVAAAERLGIPRSTLYQKLKAFGIDPAGYRG
jgi:DNA-binding NtrC family response regulator